MLNRLRNRHFFLLDVILTTLAAYFSFVLRLERFDLDQYWPSFAVFAVVAVVVAPLIFRLSGIYSRYWRYASIDELLRLVGATTVVALLTGLFAWFALHLLPVTAVLPRSIPFLFLLLFLPVAAGPRLAVRVFSRYRRSPNVHSPHKVVAVMGAGDAGAMIVREAQNSDHLNLDVVGFFDDDLGKHDVHIHGVPVLGGRHDIPRFARNYRLDQVIIAIPTASGSEIREIVDICEEAGVATKTIPGIYELIDGTVSVQQLRDVEVEDLLRREPIHTDTAAVEKLIRGKRVLITGGGGSIGSELCRQILRCGPSEMVLLGHGENSIFAIMHELQKQVGPQQTLTTVIADIRFVERLRTVFRRYQPQLVFHAAAHKHVPLMEANPSEAITNNVLGTRNLLEVAQESGVERFVMISTDKAVNPTSVMGASKRVAELLVHRAAKASGLPYVTVRFGNVLGSSGSVLLTFKKQVADGGPVTVTDPEMKRYFMTIPEAVQLVLQAAVLGEGGEVFVLDMGEPVKIVDLARDVIELSGLEVGRDVEIVFTGTRPGEKLFEELFIEGEAYQRTGHQKIFIGSNASSFIPDNLGPDVEALINCARNNNDAAIRTYLRRLIPEYRPDGNGARRLEEAEEGPVTRLGPLALEGK